MFEGLYAVMILEGAGYAFIGALALALWQDIRGKSLPEIEFIKDPGSEIKLHQSKMNLKNRSYYVFTTCMVAAFFGAMEVLIYLGFMEESNVPNRFGRAFISLLTGFMTPVFGAYIDGLKVKDLIEALKKTFNK